MTNQHSVSIYLLVGFVTAILGCSDQNNKDVASIQPKNDMVENWIGTPHDPSNPHAQLNPDQFIKVALQHQEEGRPREALSTLNDALKLHEASAELYFVRSQLQSQNNSLTEALSDIEKAIELDQNIANYRVNRAQLYRQFGRDEQAMHDLNRAIELDNRHIAAFFNRGALKYGQQNLAGALEDFDQCVALDPHSPAAYFNRAAVNNELGNTQAAMKDIERFLQISNNEQWNDIARELQTHWKTTKPEGQS